MMLPAGQAAMFGRGVRVIAFDPGSVRTGWAVVEHDGQRLTRIDSGEIRPATTAAPAVRLHVIHRNAVELLDRYQAIPVAIEAPYIPRPEAPVVRGKARRKGSAKGAIMLAQARGALLAAVGDDEHRQLIELAPSTVKLQVAGFGAASKPQVMSAVRALLDYRREIGQDEADALAVGICATMRLRLDSAVVVS